MVDITTIPTIFVVTGAMFLTFIYLVLGTVYIMDFFVRLVTNDRYVVIHKVDKAR